MHGTRFVETPDTSLPPPGDREAVGSTGDGRPARRERATVAACIAAGLALAVGIVGGRLSLQPRVDDLQAERKSLSIDLARSDAERDTLTSDIDVLESERDGLSRTVADLRSAADEDATTIAGLDTDLTTERARAAALEAKNEALRSAIAASLEAARIPALDWLIFDDEFAAGVAASDADLGLANELLSDLGADETFEEWTRGDGDWRAYNRAVAELDDGRIQDALDRYWDAPVGSAEEGAALLEYQWRLHHLILRPLTDADMSTD